MTGESADPFELIVAVILSAQCTDERVNMVTPDLFDRFPDIHALSHAESTEIFPFIRSVTYPNNKSRHLALMARRVVDEYGHERQLGKRPGCLWIGRRSVHS